MPTQISKTGYRLVVFFARWQCLACLTPTITRTQCTFALQRRCYWLLNGDDGTVLVHYLANKKIMASRAHTAPLGLSEPIASHIWDTARVDTALESQEHIPLPSRHQLGYQSHLQDTCMNFEEMSQVSPPSFLGTWTLTVLHNLKALHQIT